MKTPSFELYRILGHRFVRGWLDNDALTVVSLLDSVQRAQRVTGAVAEIGVHHGQFFIGLNLLKRATERAVAIDVFEDQQFNVDNSGKGDLQAFRSNVRRWSSLDGVEILKSDSTAVTPEQLLAHTGGTVRLFSIDGGHTRSIVVSDMKLAQSTLSPGGVAIADDVFNQHWPDVISGILDYLTRDGSLEPFGISAGKVYFTQSDFAGIYREALIEHFFNRPSFWVRSTEFSGRSVVTVMRVRPALRGVLGAIKTARAST